MAGIEDDTPIPVEITLQRQSRSLEVAYEDGSRYSLSHEFLRVFTPSAEARGHGPGQEILQVGKREVTIEAIEPVGNYAIRPVFSDGHDSGIYSWDLLHNLCVHHDALWDEYLHLLAARGGSRDAAPAAAPTGGKSCSSHKH
jgi:DUF971 family protein